MAGQGVDNKDPKNVEPFFFRFCDETGLNDGSAADEGRLQGATISSITSITADTGITVGAYNSQAVTVDGISFAANTVVTVWLSGGTDYTDYEVECVIVTSDSRTLAKTMIVPVKQM
jgi:hypothetical protein